ncbi:CrcB protein [Fervidobacterium changbaicum]|uniref:Fluoride-specific ion channel FluC n=2 Tax=Fervidobacterium TaxID=2422 RepID=A0AAI8CJG4_FERIS|nr:MULTISPECIES: fluoride efflux transporter CrcB [Fervidobacterium]AMW32126.1 fluoride efflux transporter CrcB [Fervidobacterium islandicum]QAV33897.1 fluoride efflux transporter CrcB [Fervidobacterium changbaicum]SDH73200.1 CrcB protein [Fervidobacterium changbaicum]
MRSGFWIKLAAVGTGGFLGSIIRYLISLWLNERYPNSFVPYGTLVVNIIGSFLLGAIMQVAFYIPMNLSFRLFLTTGIMGGLTTFSTLTYETMSLVYSGSYFAATLNILFNLVLGLSSAFGGKELVDLIFAVL